MDNESFKVHEITVTTTDKHRAVMCRTDSVCPSFGIDKNAEYTSTELLVLIENHMEDLKKYYNVVFTKEQVKLIHKFLKGE